MKGRMMDRLKKREGDGGLRKNVFHGYLRKRVIRHHHCASADMLVIQM